MLFYLSLCSYLLPPEPGVTAMPRLSGNIGTLLLLPLNRLCEFLDIITKYHSLSDRNLLYPFVLEAGKSKVRVPTGPGSFLAGLQRC